MIDDLVLFRVKKDDRGRLQAMNVSFYVTPGGTGNNFVKRFSSVIFAILFLFFLVVSVWYMMLPFAVLGYYILLGGITFFAYSVDKSAAQENEWRISEKSLHILSLIGGWPGALLAQVFIRHKSK